MTKNIYIWKCDILKSFEYAVFEDTGASKTVTSTVIITPNDAIGCKIDYSITLNSFWEFVSFTMKADVIGEEKVLTLKKTNNDWFLNNELCPELIGCTDLDVGFSPLTNAFPIHRLNLIQNKTVDITAAWVKFPSFEIKPLKQMYTLLDPIHYLYESGTNFKAKLQVNIDKFVINYPKYWELVRSF